MVVDATPSGETATPPSSQVTPPDSCDVVGGVPRVVEIVLLLLLLVSVGPSARREWGEEAVTNTNDEASLSVETDAPGSLAIDVEAVNVGSGAAGGGVDAGADVEASASWAAVEQPRRRVPVITRR